MAKQYTAEDIIKLQTIIRNMDIDSLDREIRNNSEKDNNCSTLGDCIVDSRPGPDEILEEKDYNQQIMKIVDMLDPRECRVIKMHFGLEDKAYTLEEIGEVYGVSRSRVQQIEAKALRKLKWLFMKYKIKED